jgi:hypothetical protein
LSRYDAIDESQEVRDWSREERMGVVEEEKEESVRNARCWLLY